MSILDIFKRKPKTTDELLEKCEDKWREFHSYIHLSHTRSYFEFKMKFDRDTNYLINEIVSCQDDGLKRKLINHLQKQLDYVQDNCFGPNSDKAFRQFMKENYPYAEKIELIKQEHNDSLVAAEQPAKFEKFIQQCSQQIEKLSSHNEVLSNGENLSFNDNKRKPRM